MTERNRDREEFYEQALRFNSDEDLISAMQEMDEIGIEVPVEYDIVGQAIVFPTRLADSLTTRLNELGINFSKVKVRPISDLSPEQQFKMRHGLNKPRSGKLTDDLK